MTTTKKPKRCGAKALPCPFCGNMVFVRRVNYIYPEGRFLCFAIGCTCKMWPDTYHEGQHYRSKDVVIKTWNRRTRK